MSAGPSHPSQSQNEFPLRVGAGISDITPPLEAGILMSSVERRWAPFEGVRLPLYARAVVIESGNRRIALVSLDLLGLADEAVGGMAHFRDLILAAAKGCISQDKLVITCTHTHSAPEMIALSDLPLTPIYKQWIPHLAAQIGHAILAAVQNMEPCYLAIASTRDETLGIHRRIKTTQGIMMSHPPPPPELVLSREGAVDPSINVASFINAAGKPIALLVNATCHPVNEMCIKQISPDYPGVMSTELEHRFEGATALFFNGAAGNINPTTVSGGPAAADRHGLALAARVTEPLHRTNRATGHELGISWVNVDLPARKLDGSPRSTTARARIAAVRIGDAAFVFLPGEPFVETGLAIREKSPFPFTSVVGYAEDYVGYIPTDEAFREGGYEIGPGGWSYLAPGCEPLVRRAAIDLLERLHKSP